MRRMIAASALALFGVLAVIPTGAAQADTSWYCKTC